MAIAVGGSPMIRTMHVSFVHEFSSLQFLAPPHNPVAGSHDEPHKLPHPHPMGAVVQVAAQLAVSIRFTEHGVTESHPQRPAHVVSGAKHAPVDFSQEYLVQGSRSNGTHPRGAEVVSLLVTVHSLETASQHAS